MDFSPAALCASFVTSTVGLGLFLYGKRELRTPQLVTGIAMMAYPLFIGGAAAIWAVGAALAAGCALAVRAGL